MAKQAGAAPKSRKNYRQMSEELTNILEWFEGADVDLDAAVKKYEEAINLLNEMEKYLKTAQNKINKISTASE